MANAPKPLGPQERPHAHLKKRNDCAFINKEDYMIFFPSDKGDHGRATGTKAQGTTNPPRPMWLSPRPPPLRSLRDSAASVVNSSIAECCWHTRLAAGGPQLPASPSIPASCVAVAASAAPSPPTVVDLTPSSLQTPDSCRPNPPGKVLRWAAPFTLLGHWTHLFHGHWSINPGKPCAQAWVMER